MAGTGVVRYFAGQGSEYCACPAIGPQTGYVKRTMCTLCSLPGQVGSLFMVGQCLFGMALDIPALTAIEAPLPAPLFDLFWQHLARHGQAAGAQKT
ncbi:hypothetical protein D3C76_1001590 [compost metagenome]